MKPLFLTSCLFLLPIYSYFISGNILVIPLICNFIFSCLFWYDTRKGTIIHKIDVIFARFTILCFIIYIIFFKKFNYLTYSLIMLIFTLVYFSHLSSSTNWYSNDHIVYHGLFHFTCVITSLSINC
jgi:hypothetical protein